MANVATLQPLCRGSSSGVATLHIDVVTNVATLLFACPYNVVTLVVNVATLDVDVATLHFDVATMSRHGSANVSTLAAVLDVATFNFSVPSLDAVVGTLT